MLIVPNTFHGEGGHPYPVRRRWDYFVRYLLGVTPPENFEMREECDPAFGLRADLDLRYARAAEFAAKACDAVSCACHGMKHLLRTCHQA
jgi:hypothetical protein